MENNIEFDKLKGLFECMQITEDNVTKIENDMKQLYNILCEPNSNEIVNETIILTLDSDLLKSVVYKYLQQSLLSEKIQENETSDVVDEPDQIMSDQKALVLLKLTIDIMSQILKKAPSNLEKLENLIDRIEIILSEVKDNGSLYDLFKRNVLCFKEEILEREVSFQDAYKKTHNKKEDTRQPPEDFRDLPTIPKLDEIKSSKNLFLRSNLPTGPFNSVEHYLDVQFRLLREDYVGSLREGVVEYLALENMKKDKKNQVKSSGMLNIRVYQNIKITGYVLELQGMVHKIKLDMSGRLGKVRWETSKRLLQGSLICFSNDNYKTAFFATVFDRDCKDLKKGELLVKFDDWIGLERYKRTLKQPAVDFTMIETTTYFESYRYTLESLKKLNENNLPFKNHIVYSSNALLASPRYLKQVVEDFYDFRPMIKDQYTIQVETFPRPQPPRRPDNNNKNNNKVVNYPNIVKRKYMFLSNEHSRVPVLDSKLWPTSTILGLNPSQYDALKLALTKELVVIQGPPGTGKTFVGVEVLKMLLHNCPLLRPVPQPLVRQRLRHQIIHVDEIQSPILIVCYTNHALDQLLMLVSKYLNEGEEDIVRIGGRCQEPALEGCSIVNIKNRLKDFRSFPQNVRDRLKTSRIQLETAKKLIEEILKEFNNKFHELISLDLLRKYFYNIDYKLVDRDIKEFYKLNFTERSPSKVFLDWLGIGDLPLNFNRAEINNFLTTSMESNYENDEFYYDQLNTDQNNPDTSTQLSNADQDIDEETNEIFYDVEDDNMIEEAELENEKRETLDDLSYKAKVKKLFDQNNNNNTEPVQKDKEDNPIDEPNEPFNMFLYKMNRNEKYRRLKLILSNMDDRMDEGEADQIFDYWRLDMNDRYRLYRYFHYSYNQKLKDKLEKAVEHYKTSLTQFDAARDDETLFILRKAKIIGMTTTGAAKNQALMQKLKPSIVLAEEAAEVFESHIVTCLTESCKHLILIGDNEQLKPSPNLYKLAKHYSLDVSLFERLVNNNIPRVRLNVQHRMRPDISFLMKYFYDDLIDNDNVKQYEKVNGLKKSVYFIHHEYAETGDEESLSKSNIYEAEYITRLCDYLLKQNYAPEKITILVAYGGQLLAVKNKISTILNEKYAHSSLKKVRVTPIDNYQGEENDIILLSLVRSNNYGKIGFLAVSNRICVALSRAKKGLYVLGNFKHLANHSKLWSKIVQDLRERDMIGNKLDLFCQNHPDKVREIVNAADFKECIDGGCNEKCGQRLDCGHSCVKFCHVTSHDEVKCMKPCERLYKKCSKDHKCNRLCYQECDDCPVMLSKTVPRCGHSVTIKCSEDPSQAICPTPVPTQLECGHIKGIKCHSLYLESLKVKGLNRAQAKKDVELFRCVETIQKLFEPCKHIKRIRCCYADREKCTEMVEKKHPFCGHMMTLECSEDILRKECFEKIKILLICGHKVEMFCKDNKPDDMSTYKCQELVSVALKCGHNVCVPCATSSSAKCTEKCSTVLDCGHRCSGECRDCTIQNIHPNCKSFCGKQLICGHICQLKCGLPCFTCTKECSFKCPHFKCKEKCFSECQTCNQKCAWSCVHKPCFKKCFELCNLETCNERCTKKLKCKHECLSVCKEYCLCKCTKGLDETKKYIKLFNCDCIIPIEVLDSHMEQESNRLNGIIGFPICPKCSTPIYYSLRYNQLVRNQFRKLNDFKQSQLFNKETAKHCSQISFLMKQNATPAGKFAMDDYMKTRIYVNTQLNFVINRYNAWKTFTDTKQKLAQIPSSLKDKQVELKIERMLERTAFQITNKEAYELSAKVLIYYYHYACAKNDQSPISAMFLNDLSTDSTTFSSNFITDSQSMSAIIGRDEIIDIKNIFKEVDSVYKK